MKIEERARAKLADLRTALAGDPEGARGAFKELFPDGLTFEERADERGRRAWAVKGTAQVGRLTASSDPTGT